MLDFLRRRTQSEHERISVLLSAYLDGELTAREQQQVEAHLTHCETCAQDLQTLRYAKAVLTEAPAPRLPRSFVVRRVDLEEQPTAAPRRLFGLRPGLAYAYLRGATAVVAVAFALLVAGDLISQRGVGGVRSLQPAFAPAEQALQVQEEAAVGVSETTQGPPAEKAGATDKALPATEVEQTVEVEKEMEVVVESVVTPTEVARQALPTASLPVGEEAHKDELTLTLPEGAPTEAAAAEELASTEVPAVENSYSPDQTSVPALTPTSPPLPTALPRATLEPQVPPVAPDDTEAAQFSREFGYWRPSAIRVAEVGLGGLVLILVILTLIVRRQRP
jgi:hypothetical protein